MAREQTGAAGRRQANGAEAPPSSTKAGPSKAKTPAKGASGARDDLLRYYRDMLLIRRFEERAGQLYGMGLIGGFCHLYIGQEAIAVGVQAAQKPGDQVITTPISLVSGMLTTLADPNGQNPATALVSGIAVYAVLVAVGMLFGAIGAVIQPATIALIYIDLRMRKEGLDLDLARFVEARQSGMTGLADPYARRPDQPPAPSTLPPSSESPWT